jgi:hypothetical protein
MERCRCRFLRSTLRCVAIAALLSVTLHAPAQLHAQGSTTAAISGTIRFTMASGSEALVRVVNVATGYVIQTRSHSGRFVVQGLIPGGPYQVSVSSVGFSPRVVTGVYLLLGERRDFDFTLLPLAVNLDTIRVSTTTQPSRASLSGGVGTLVSDSTLRRLPSANRDLYDYLRLVPQVTTRFGLTGGGASFRFNSFTIDGVSDRQLQGNNVLGASSIGGKSISLEAVKEYEVLLTPYDARFGNFAGMLVNAITMNGTNELHGSVFGYFRNGQLSRTSSFVAGSPFQREQFGISVGGPLIKDRLHFFVAAEQQLAEAPTLGPYIGQSENISPAVPVQEADDTQFISVLHAAGLEAGDGSRVTALNPATTIFARIDLGLPELKSRVVIRDDHSSVELTRFSRSDNVSNFPLTSNAWTNTTKKHGTAIQIFTQGSSRVMNELMIARIDRPIVAEGFTPAPNVQVRVNGNGTSPQIIAGPSLPVSGIASSQLTTEIGDHLTIQAGSHHTVALGSHVEVFNYHGIGVRGSFGQWKFGNLKDLAAGDATSYVLTKDFGSAEASVKGAEPSAYITDEWRPSDRLSLSVGLRADALNFSSRGRYNPSVDSIFGRRTDDYPQTRVELSPRLGFNWNPIGELHLRGGAGVFTGPAPLGWLVGPLRSNGAGVRTLTCAGAVGSGRVPKFVADVNAQPLECPGGQGFADGPVALVDRDLQIAKSFRTSLAIEQNFPGKITGSVEGLYSRVLSDFMFVNTALVGPVGTDVHGRSMYGRIDKGKATPAYVSDRFKEVIDLRNHSVGHAWSVTAQAERPFTDRLEFQASYTYSRVRDLQSLTNGSAVSPLDIWAGGRPTSGRHDDMHAGISSFDIPHRVVIAATFASPWKKWSSDFSFYYVGESGSPFTFNDSTSDGLGDLNADGTGANDPIYVPRSVEDRSGVTFADTTGAQAAAFDRFIDATPCLRRQRGSIVARNSCRGAWVNTTNASFRQSLSTLKGHSISLQLEVYNVLNLVRQSWGLYRVPNDKILQYVVPATGQPFFVFDATRARSNTQNLESASQAQVSLRYNF